MAINDMISSTAIDVLLPNQLEWRAIPLGFCTHQSLGMKQAK